MEAVSAIVILVVGIAIGLALALAVIVWSDSTAVRQRRQMAEEEG